MHHSGRPKDPSHGDQQRAICLKQGRAALVREHYWKIWTTSQTRLYLYLQTSSREAEEEGVYTRQEGSRWGKRPSRQHHKGTRYRTRLQIAPQQATTMGDGQRLGKHQIRQRGKTTDLVGLSRWKCFNPPLDYLKPCWEHQVYLVQPYKQDTIMEVEGYFLKI
jgi:hypothetical protein